MSILRPQGAPEGVNTSSNQPNSGRAGTLRKALGALLIAAAGLTAAGCDGCGCGKKNDQSELMPEQKPTAAATSKAADGGSADPNRVLPSGERPLDKVSMPQFARVLFEKSPAFHVMETGGSRPYAHFKVGGRVKAVRVSTDAEVDPQDIAQVNCTEGSKQVTDLFIKSENVLYRLPDCERDSIKGDPNRACVKLSYPLPLSKEQKEKDGITYIENRTTDIKPFPDDTLFQISQQWPGTKPGCGDVEAVAVVTPPPKPPRTYNYTPPAPKNYVTREDYDDDRAAQAQRDEGQDREIATKASQKDVDALKAYWSCHYPNGAVKPVCKDIDQSIIDNATKPRNK